MADHPALADFFWGKTGLEDESPYSGCVAVEKRLTEGKTSMSQFKAILLERSGTQVFVCESDGTCEQS